jgi:hypothetical protein
MAIYYIDVDDEITSAAARIRDSSDTRIALVIQGGSRVATSRINFRLLAREARHHGKRLAIVATDPSARSLAQAAGLPLYASVAEYQKAESARPPGTQPGGADGVGDAPDELAATVDSGSGGRAARLTGAAGSRRAIGPGQPAARSGRRLGVGASRWLALGLVAALAVGAIGAFLLLPNATVVLTLREVPVGPLNLTIKVDPGITATNDSTLMVPGISKEFTAQVSGTFDATGQNVAETAATGTVTFTSWNTASVVQIPAGTQVETAAKVAFATTSAVTVPKAVVPGGFTPGTADVGVAAVRKGLSGNVAAGAIVNVPAWLATALVVPDQVTNKKATSGGTHTVTPFVQQSDIDAAEVSLAKQLDSSVMVRMNEPASVAAGLELFPKTAHMGDASFDPDPATLLSQQLTSFDLAATGTATATATNLATVRSLAERKVRAKVQAGHALVEGSVVVALGSPTATGSAVSVPVVASGLQAATVDVDQLRAAIKGKSVAEAKAYLSTYGDAEVSISPFWVSTISGFDFRIDVRVIAPTARPTATAILGATARVTLAPGRTATPTEVAPPTEVATPTGAATPTEGATPGPSASAEPSPTATPEATASSEASPTATP